MSRFFDDDVLPELSIAPSDTDGAANVNVQRSETADRIDQQLFEALDDAFTGEQQGRTIAQMVVDKSLVNLGFFPLAGTTRS